MNTQEALIRIVVHCCIIQGKQSSAGFSCLYAGPDGNSCAVGCLLPRALAQALDGNDGGEAWGDVVRGKSTHERKARKLLKGVRSSFLSIAQRIHDTTRARNPYTRKLMWKDFSDLARAHKIHMPTIMEIGAELTRLTGV
jgi:hypothetical protein